MEVQEAINKKGTDWVVAAMVEGSIGYHSPGSARRLVKDYLEGRRTDYCERCMACFSCNLEKMIKYDIQTFERLEEILPAKAKRIIAFCKKMEDLDCIQQTTVGLLYPSLGF